MQDFNRFKKIKINNISIINTENHIPTNSICTPYHVVFALLGLYKQAEDAYRSNGPYFNNV